MGTNLVNYHQVQTTAEILGTRFEGRLEGGNQQGTAPVKGGLIIGRREAVLRGFPRCHVEGEGVLRKN